MANRCFILGAPKCGTTTLAHWLDQTDSIFMCDPKEPHFYSSDYTQNWVNLEKSKTAYEALFSAATSEQQATVDGSTNYLSSVDAVQNITQDYPDAKFVVCLRNPIDMARSLHAHNLFWGNETIPDFKKAWDAQVARKSGLAVPNWHSNPRQLQYREVCSTGTQIERLLTMTTMQNVMFVFIEDLSKNPEKTYSEVVNFLGGTPQNDIKFESRNVTKERIFPSFNIKIRHLKSKSTPRVLRKIINVAGDINSRWNERPAVKSKLDPAFRTALAEEFSSEIDKLSALTGRDLSHWKA